MKDLITILSSGAVSLLLSGALVFIFKNWISERIKTSIQHEYDQKLETHKAQLKAQSDIEIEKLKSQLQVAGAERNVRFSHVFERTAETIVKTYQLLQEVLWAVQNYTDAVEVRSAPGDLEMAREQINKSAQEFFTYFHANKIYIPKKTMEKTWQFLNTLERFKTNSIMLAAAERTKLSDEQLKERHDRIEALREQIPKLMESLYVEFQEILGLPKDETPSKKENV
jgi:hypothetical protein